MNQWVERYIYDVARRLPEKERDEVSRELQANIYDMLPEGADDEAVKEVLCQLGPPAKLADQYRQGPRYLISPAVYGDYVRALKWIVPLVGVVVLVIGLIVGIFDEIGTGVAPLHRIIGSSLSSGISAGIGAAFQALVWTTVGFVIADRAGYSSEASGASSWQVEDLPETMPADKARIPLSDSIAELVITLVFFVAAVLFCAGMLPIFIVKEGGTLIQTPFSAGFAELCIPALVVLAILGVASAVVRIKDRRWTPLVCGISLVDHILSAVIWIYLATRPDMFNVAFLAYVGDVNWGDFDILRFIGQSINPVLGIFVLIVLAVTVAGCATAIYKTVRYASPRTSIT